MNNETYSVGSMTAQDVALWSRWGMPIWGPEEVPTAVRVARTPAMLHIATVVERCGSELAREIGQTA
jgi:hypothetical protein